MLDKGTIDMLVLIVCVASAAFAGGLWIGEEKARTEVATKCIPQAGEKLVSVQQDKTGVTCIWSQHPMTAKKARKAA